MTLEIYTYFGRVAKVLTSDKLGTRAFDDARAELLKLERETGNEHWIRTK